MFQASPSHWYSQLLFWLSQLVESFCDIFSERCLIMAQGVSTRQKKMTVSHEANYRKKQFSGDLQRRRGIHFLDCHMVFMETAKRFWKKKITLVYWSVPLACTAGCCRLCSAPQRSKINWDGLMSSFKFLFRMKWCMMGTIVQQSTQHAQSHM